MNIQPTTFYTLRGEDLIGCPTAHEDLLSRTHGVLVDMRIAEQLQAFAESLGYSRRLTRREDPDRTAERDDVVPGQPRRGGYSSESQRQAVIDRRTIQPARPDFLSDVERLERTLNGLLPKPGDNSHKHRCDFGWTRAEISDIHAIVNAAAQACRDLAEEVSADSVGTFWVNGTPTKKKPGHEGISQTLRGDAEQIDTLTEKWAVFLSLAGGGA